jgi:hypothetical protein
MVSATLVFAESNRKHSKQSQLCFSRFIDKYIYLHFVSQVVVRVDRRSSSKSWSSFVVLCGIYSSG